MGSTRYTDVFHMLRAIRLHVEENEGHIVLCADDPVTRAIGFACQQCYREIWWVNIEDFHKFTEKGPNSHWALLRLLFLGQRSRAHIAEILSQQGKFDPRLLLETPHDEDLPTGRSRFERIEGDDLV